MQAENMYINLVGKTEENIHAWETYINTGERKILKHTLEYKVLDLHDWFKVGPVAASFEHGNETFWLHAVRNTC
jgi:hypothetical protein